MKTFALLAVIALVVAGCTRLSDHGFDQKKLVADTAKGSVRLADYAPFKWDRVYVFAPYTPAEIIKEEVGTRVPFPNANSEGHCLLVFLFRGEVVAAFEEERKDADFAELYRKGGYSPEEAVFVSEVRASDHWRFLKTKAANQ